MHELGVVDSLVIQAVAETTRRDLAARVRVVHLRLGALTTFVPAAMEFYFDALKKGTPLQNAALEIEEVAVAGSCNSCGAPVSFEALPFVCNRCGSGDVTITAGRELEITSFEVDDE